MPELTLIATIFAAGFDGPLDESLERLKRVAKEVFDKYHDFKLKLSVRDDGYPDTEQGVIELWGRLS